MVPTKPLSPKMPEATRGAYDTKVVAIGWAPMDSRGENVDPEGLPKMIYEDSAKNAAAFEQITDAFAAKGWLPWISISIPGVNAQYLVWIRPKE